MRTAGCEALRTSDSADFEQLVAKHSDHDVVVQEVGAGRRLMVCGACRVSASLQGSDPGLDRRLTLVRTLYAEPVVPRPCGAIAAPHGPGVYYVHSPATRTVKIGRAADIARRMGSLQTGSPLRLHLIAWERGPELERERHTGFAALRESPSSEWFYLRGPLVEHVDGLRRRLGYDPLDASLLAESRARPSEAVNVSDADRAVLARLAPHLAAEAKKLLGTMTFKSSFRREMQQALVAWLAAPETADPFTSEQWTRLMTKDRYQGKKS